MKRTIICAAICVITAALSSLGDLLHPDVLLMPDGTRIASAKEWSLKARPQILDFFEKNVYGKIPPRPAKLEFVLAEKGDDALGGLAKRRQYRIVSTDVCGTHSFDVLVYLPKDAAGPVPAFVCPNFNGNHAITDDPNVILPTCPLYRGLKPDDPDRGRGWRPDYFPVRDVVKAGFAIDARKVAVAGHSRLGWAALRRARSTSELPRAMCPRRPASASARQSPWTLSIGSSARRTFRTKAGCSQESRSSATSPGIARKATIR